ncbi:MAG: hypothetical protein IK116_00475 [Firmicutes bacterium]|nr:hypothetical protein [Bacillota bacterium]
MKKRIIAGLILLILLPALSFTLLRPPDAADAARLLEQAWERPDYGFRARATVETEGALTPFFELEGRVQGDASQVSGTVLGQPVEMRCRAGELTQLLPNGELATHRLADLGELGRLYAELLPRSAFEFQGVAEYRVSREGGGLELRLTPEQAQGWVGDYFSQPVYILRCGPLGRRLRGLTLTATEKVNGRARLRLEVTLDD